MASRPRASVVLFKPTDLRLHDHAPLGAAHKAAAQDGLFVLHLLVLDVALGFGPAATASREAGLPRLGHQRAAFVLQSIVALHEALAAKGFELLVYVGSTQDALAAVASLLHIEVFAHGPELCSEEQRIEQSVAASHRLHLFWGWTLAHIDDLPPNMQRGHSMPARYKPFLDAVSRGKGPANSRPPLPEPRWTAPDTPVAIRNLVRATATGIHRTNEGCWGLPQSVDALLARSAVPLDIKEPSGQPTSQPLQPGGEAAALTILRTYVWEEGRLCRYVGSSDSMTPGADNALNATTRLSAYLAHGCLSARRLYSEVRAYETRRVRNRSTYWVYHELTMRDFLAFSCFTWGRRLFSAAGPLDASGHEWRDPRAKETRRLFLLWTQGRTGYPFVDAGMRQLRAEGWMPHLLRQMCAAFLVRDLRVPWRWGAEWFEHRLVDYTPDANWGNWGYRILPVHQLLAGGLSTTHLTSLELLSWPIIHDPNLEYTLVRARISTAWPLAHILPFSFAHQLLTQSSSLETRANRRGCPSCVPSPRRAGRCTRVNRGGSHQATRERSGSTCARGAIRLCGS